MLTANLGGTLFSHTAIIGEINGTEGYFPINFPGQNDVTVSDLNNPSTFVFINKFSQLEQQTNEPTREDLVNKIFTMRIAIDTISNTILEFQYLNNPIGHYANSLRDVYTFLLAQGVPFKRGQVVTGRSTDLGFDISSGSLMVFGGTGNIYNPNILQFDLTEIVEFYLAQFSSINPILTQFLPKFWDNNGVLTALGSTTFVGHRIYRLGNGDVYLQYGQANYANIVLARAGVVLENYKLNPLLKDATFFGWWFIEDTATNTGGGLPLKTEFKEYTIGIQGGSSSGLSGAVLRGNNGSDFLDIPQTRINLGLGNGITTSGSFSTLVIENGIITGAS